MERRSLDPYRSKRDPARTPEPFGPADAKGPRLAGQRFVVQQHAARRMHWDLRLEIDGVLVSWAIPRGPSGDPRDKRLAVQTEDHPVEYAQFEGIIPAGNYGAGAMIVWDAGSYAVAGSRAPADALAAGKLDLDLCGYKLRGPWTLIRTSGGTGSDWLLVRSGEAAAASDLVAAYPASILSGLTVAELRAGRRRDDDVTRLAAAAGARPASAPPALAPMLAESAAAAFSRPGWVFELKYDGVRVMIARRAGATPRLIGRSGRDMTAIFPEVAAAAAHLPLADFVIDAELIAADPRGTGSFERLQQRLGLSNAWDVARGTVAVPVQAHGFDLPFAAGYDLRPLPLTTRKQILQTLLPPRGVVAYAEHIEEDGEAVFAAACAHGGEGIIAKRADSAYASGRRSRDWIKIKAPRRATLAVVGYVPGRGGRERLGALMVAWRTGGELTYAGNVGSGLSPAVIDAVLPRLEAARRKTPAFVATDPLARGAVFVEPAWVADVRYTEVTERGVLRQPVLLDLRPLGADELTPMPTPAEAEAAPLEPAPAPAADPTDAAPLGGSRFVPSNVGKVYWPRDGYTKGDLLGYYEAIWPALQIYLCDRPLVLTRYPDGIDGKHFYQHNAPDFVPDWIETCRVGDTEHFVCNELDALLYVINLGCIPLHMASARRQSLDHPDWAILDLDPKDAPFADVIAIARCIHDLLAPLQVPHFLKTSGQDGLHVLIPLGGALTHEEARSFAEVVARLVVAARPDIATVARPLGGRGGKVYVDFLQNGAGKTIAAPFSVRPRPGAPVSTPLAWSELDAALDPARFTLRTVPERLARAADPMGSILDEPIDIAAALAKLGAHVATAQERPPFTRSSRTRR